MTKSLTVSIDDVEKAERVSITGTQDPTQFVSTIVLSVGLYRVSLSSLELAEALSVVVDYQTPPKGTYIIPSGSDITAKSVDYLHEPVAGMTNLGWTK